MASSSLERVNKRRAQLRAAGFRPIQIWVPDTRAHGFAAECARQSKRVRATDCHDVELAAFLDAALDDLADDRGEGSA